MEDKGEEGQEKKKIRRSIIEINWKEIIINWILFLLFQCDLLYIVSILGFVGVFRV